MSRDKNEIEISGVDRMELFLQNYFKQIIIFIGLIVLAFIIIYAGFSIHKSSKNKKAVMVNQYELDLTTPEKIEKFSQLKSKVSFLKDYISIRSAEAWIALNNKQAAIKELKDAGGKFKEIRDGLAYDLGEKIDLKPYLTSSYMPVLWNYRNIKNVPQDNLSSTINTLKFRYPSNALVRLLDNWYLQ